MARYSIKAPIECNGMGWGLAWANGLAFTDNSDLAAKLARKGYTVKDAMAPVEETEPETSVKEPEKPFESMTVTELRSFAAAHGIDVTGASKKQDLLLAVQTAMEPGAAQDTEDAATQAETPEE